MTRLIKGARFKYEAGASDFHEVDEGFDRGVAALCARERGRRETQASRNTNPIPAGKLYHIRGRLFAEDMAVPLEEDFRAESLDVAKGIVDDKAREYHEVEGYAVSLFLFDKLKGVRTSLHHAYVGASKD